MTDADAPDPLDPPDPLAPRSGGGEPPPRVTLEVGDPELRARILWLLDGVGIEIEEAEPATRTVLPAAEAPESAPPATPPPSATPLSDRPPASERTTPESADDVRLLSRREFLAQVERALDDPTARSELEEGRLVVLTDRDDPADRARLVAAGAAAVIPVPSRGDRRAFAASITDELARAEDASAPAIQRGLEDVPRISDFASGDPRMEHFVEAVRRVVDADTPLLLLGETGVGKERLARAIHGESPRAAAPFVTVNCGALPANLLESELFGHEEGAFTGATERRRGRFELAGEGTVFLDEIGEMPPELQVRLLDVLQRQQFRPVGAEEPIAMRARVVAATHRDLGSDVRAGRFREDLFYRLHVMPLEIPPLRERKEGLAELIGRFLRSLSLRLERMEVPSISRPALERLFAHDWPGNVRELGNVLERALLVAAGSRIEAEDLIFAAGTEATTVRPPERGEALPPIESAADYRTARDAWLDRFEREYFAALLEETGGRIGAVARRAGLAERTVYEKLKKLGLRKEDFRPR